MAKDKENGNKIEGLEFDLSKVTMGELDDLNAANRAARFKDAAAILAKFCTKCPPAWGDPNEASTFYNRPRAGEGSWGKVNATLVEALNELGE